MDVDPRLLALLPVLAVLVLAGQWLLIRALTSSRGDDP